LAAEKPFTGVSLRLVIDQLPWVAQGLKLHVKEFEKLTGAKVIVLDIPYHDLHEKIMVDLVTQTGTYNIVLPDGAWAAEVIESGQVMNIDEFVEGLKKDPEYDFEDLVPGALDFVYRKGHWYGLPATLHSNAFMIYRKDLLKDAGLDVPVYWEDYNNMAQFFTGYKTSWGDTIPYGCISSGERDDPIIMEWMNRMLNSGGTYEAETGIGCLWDKNWNPTFHKDPGLEGAKLLLQHFSWGPPGPSTVTWDTMSRTYLEGRVATVGTWDIVFGDFENPEVSKVVGKNHYDRIPFKKGTNPSGLLAGRFYFVPKVAKDKEAVFAFLKWVTSKSVDRETVLGSSPAPIRLSNYQDPALVKRHPGLARSLEIYKVILPEPQVPEWMTIKEYLGLALSQAATGEKSPQEALSIAADRVKKLFKKAGYVK
jgi:multiple sugar transport system substrate-binding protein